LALFTYNFFLKIYSFGIWLAGFFNQKAKKMIEGRHNLFQELETNNKFQNNDWIWVHCASLGEFEQGRPIIEALKTEFPKYKILLTFFSPSGYEIRKNYSGVHFVSYLPLDSAKNAREFLGITKPKMAIFVKYEIWFHFLNQLKINKVPTFLVSANFRKNQIFFKNYGAFFKNILFKFEHIFVQNEESFKLLDSIKYQNKTIAGDTRFDRVKSLVTNAIGLPIIENFKNNKKLLVVGSAWAQDFYFLLPFLNSNKFDLQIAIAPHEIHSSEMENWQQKLKGKSIRYSQCTDNQSFNVEEIIIIDNIGLLSSIYNYADFCWIGGAFGQGLHNILEAATYGKPVFFGNSNYEKFQEALDLIELGGAFVIGDLKELETAIGALIDGKNFYEKTAKISMNYVLKNIGASEKIMNLLRRKL
jgi:3-deoxy-D-manno-octulosonic-acid transferase